MDQQVIAFMLSLKMVSYTQFFILLTKKHTRQFWKNTESYWMMNWRKEKEWGDPAFMSRRTHQGKPNFTWRRKST